MVRPIDILRRRAKGFTLVELLVVIAIIGVLATLVLLQLGAARARSRDAKRIADVNQMNSAIQLFYDENGGKFPAIAEFSDAGLGKYIARFPMDPLNNALPYGYCTNADQSSFQVWTNLEQKNAGAINGKTGVDSTAAGWVCNTRGSIAAGGKTASECTGTGSIDTRKDCVYDQGVK